MRQVWTHTWAPDTSPKLKSLQDLSIRVNSKVTEEVMHHASLRVDGDLHLRLHMCKVIHPNEHTSPGIWQRQRFWLGCLARANHERDSNYPPLGDPSSYPHTQCPLGVLRVSLRYSRGLLCCLHMSSPTSARWSCEALVCLSHLIKLQCKTFTRVQSKPWVR
jgi:hypothetical protein